MGGFDQLDSFFNNMHSAIGGKKWYWMQIINLVQLLQVGAYCFYASLGHQTRELDFLRDIVHSHVTQCQSFIQVNYFPRMNDMEVKHYLSSITQGQCHHCRKNCRLQCEACGVCLHQNCFADYRKA